ncbi:MAG: MBL fold metallo-hydrolase [Chloroflexota bacterium]
MNQPIHISLPTPFSVGPANTYLFVEPEPLLVDCGIDTDESWNVLVDALAENGLAPADIQKVVVTHAHVDHMGMAGRIIANSPATLLIWEQIEPWAYDTDTMWQQRQDFMQTTLNQFDLADDDRNGILDGMAQTMTIWSSVPRERVETFGLDDLIQMGGLPWQVLYAPGHSNTQTCFYQPETEQFLAADMLLALTPAPVLEHRLTDNLEREISLPKLLEMFDLIEKMAIRHVYPGHGEPFSDFQELIERQRQRISLRKGECLELVRKGKEQIEDLLDVMYKHHPRGMRFTGLSALIGYLDLLLIDEAIEERIIDGKRRFIVR